MGGSGDCSNSTRCSLVAEGGSHRLLRGRGATVASELDERFHVVPLRGRLAVAIEQLDRFCFSIVRQQ